GQLDGLLALDVRLNPVQELLSGATIQLQEACDELRRYAQDIDLDPGRLDWLEQRLGAIQTLARKHRCKPAELPQLQVRLQGELAELEGGEERYQELERERDRQQLQWFKAARALSVQRQKAARELTDRVTRAMHDLGMPKGRFQVALETGQRPAPGGLETLEFQVCANPGQPLRPLAKVASGGELSRISLAIQVIIAHSARIPTMVFDEVDTGIGGAVAEVVGRLLRQLGESRQVLCVTHLPQVAVQAHHHLRVSKDVAGSTTRTGITPLEADERVGEIARMLGGLQLTDNTLAHAREMIEHAQGR
ncbi:MAG: DNA repair protein RecN, partial [Candidatus Competibacteraceae bacterium]|nr:DNA repair protein RecN [Candidatus Competibacteraceae bacterium]